MSKSSRTKGSSGERDAAVALTKATNTIWKRTAQRTGKTGMPDAAPLSEASPLNKLHVEAKRRRSIACRKFLDQAVRDSKNSGRLPLVVMREDKRTEWMVMLRLDDLRRLGEVLRDAAKPEPIGEQGGYFAIGGPGISLLNRIAAMLDDAKLKEAAKNGATE